MDCQEANATRANALETWNGRRVLVVDSVKYYLPDEKAVRAEFGGQSNQHPYQVPMVLG